MAGVIDRLVYEIGYEVDKGSYDNAMKGVSKMADGFKDLAVKATLVSTALFGFVSYTNKSTLETERLAGAVGASLDQVEAFGAEFDKIGLSQDNFIDLMEEMNNKIGEMKGLGEFTAVEESLSILGVKFEEIKDLKPEEQFKAIANASLEMADGQKAVTAVDMLLGGEANKLIASLRKQGLTYDDLMRKQQLYNYQTEESRKGAKKFGDAFLDLQRLLSSMQKFIAGIMGETMADMVNQFTNWATVNKEIISSGIKEFTKELSSLFSTLFNVVKNLATGIGIVANAVGGLANLFKILIGLSIASSVIKLISGFVLLTRAILASATAMRVLLFLFSLPGLILAGIALVAEDIYQWLNGGESLLGDMVGSADELWESFKTGLIYIKDFFSNVLDSATSFFSEIGTLILTFILAPFNVIIDQVNNLIGMINKISGSGIAKKLGLDGFNIDLIQNVTAKDVISGASEMADSGLTFLADYGKRVEPGVNAIGGNVTNNNSANNANTNNVANITINAKGDPIQIGQEVTRQMDATFKTATTNLQPIQK